MKKMQRSDYPHLADIIDELAKDNGWSHFGVQVWDWPEDADLETLEGKASQLDTDQKLIMAAGEYREMKILVKALKLKDLAEFLEEVFDGKYSRNFLSVDGHVA